VTGVRATWLSADAAAVLAAVGRVAERPGPRLLVAAGSDDRLDLARGGGSSVVAVGTLPGLRAVAIASVDAERTTAELRQTLEPDPPAAVRPVDDPWLGGRGFLLTGQEGLGLAILEPGTEGLLAARLARFGEGPCAAWLTGAGADAPSTVRMTSLGPARILHAGGRWGPFLLGLVGNPDGRSGATIAP
jgi:hypothetical protein